MGFFDRKQPKSSVKITNIIHELKEIVSSNKSMSCMFLYDSGTDGSAFVQGEGEHMERALYHASQKSEAFKNIVMNVAKKLSIDYIQNSPDAPKELKDIVAKAKRDGKLDGAHKVDLPGGGSGIVVDKRNIKNMSDDDIDDMIDKMLEGE
tara:strand:+ start:30 stop:479 length:450 start_codon:yes stop_codon:yes gene_type:complete